MFSFNPHTPHTKLGNAMIYVIIFGAAAMILVAVIFQFAIPGIRGAGEESQNTITQAIQKLQKFIGNLGGGNGNSGSGQNAQSSFDTSGLNQQETQVAKKQVQEIEQEIAQPLEQQLDQWAEQATTVSADTSRTNTVVEETAALQSDTKILANPLEGTIGLPSFDIQLPSFTLDTPQREIAKSTFNITDTTRRNGILYLQGQLQINLKGRSQKITDFEVPVPVKKQITQNIEFTLGQLAEKLGVNTGPLQPIFDTPITLQPNIPFTVELEGDFPIQEGKSYEFSGTPEFKGKGQSEPKVRIELHHRGVGSITDDKDFVKEVRITDAEIVLQVTVQVTEA